MPKEDAILSKKNKENTIPSSPKVPDTFSPNKDSAPCEVKLDKAVQSICSAKHKKKRTPSLDPKKGFAAFRRRALVPEKGVGIADVVPQAEQKRVEDKGGHDGKRENRGAP